MLTQEEQSQIIRTYEELGRIGEELIRQIQKAIKPFIDWVSRAYETLTKEAPTVWYHRGMA